MSKFSVSAMQVLLVMAMIISMISCTKETIDEPIDKKSVLQDTTLLDVKYGTEDVQVYDIYLPEGRDSSTPVILAIHGGAWITGEKEDMSGYVRLIKKEWEDVAIVNMNYRLASNQNEIHHNEMMADIKAVIAQVLEKKAAYHVSTDIAIMGWGTGGELAMIYAYKVDDLNNIKCVGNILGPCIISDWSWYHNTDEVWAGTSIADILTTYVGQSWDTTAYKAVSPYWNVTPESQPTITFHGNQDPVVPFYQGNWLQNKLEDLGVPSEHYELPAYHKLSASQQKDVVEKLVKFFKKHLEE